MTLAATETFQPTPNTHLSTTAVEGRLVLSNDVARTYVALSPAQVSLWEKLLGGQSLGEAIDELGQTNHAAAVAGFVNGLCERGLLVRTRANIARESVPRRRLTISVPTGSLTATTDLPEWARVFATKVGRSRLLSTPVVLLISAVSIGLVGDGIHQFGFGHVADLRRSALVLALSYVGLVVAFTLHEMAHAASLARFKEAPAEGGVLIRYVVLFGVFVRTSSAWTLDVRRRVLVNVAGPLMNLVIAGAVSAACLGLPAGIARSLWPFAYANLLLALFNLSPVLTRLDGYYIVGDLLSLMEWRKTGRKTIWRLVHRESTTARARVAGALTTLHYAACGLIVVRLALILSRLLHLPFGVGALLLVAFQLTTARTTRDWIRRRLRLNSRRKALANT